MPQHQDESRLRCSLDPSKSGVDTYTLDKLQQQINFWLWARDRAPIEASRKRERAQELHHQADLLDRQAQQAGAQLQELRRQRERLIQRQDEQRAERTTKRTSKTQAQKLYEQAQEMGLEEEKLEALRGTLFDQTA